MQEVVLDDRRLVRTIRQCQQLPGQQLFQYVGARACFPRIVPRGPPSPSRLEKLALALLRERQRN